MWLNLTDPSTAQWEIIESDEQIREAKGGYEGLKKKWSDYKK